MSKATKKARSAVSITLMVIAYIGGFLTWLGALALWNELYGLKGVLLGLLTISDLLLPFAWYNVHGYWPGGWILAVVLVVILYLVAGALSPSED